MEQLDKNTAWKAGRRTWVLYPYFLAIHLPPDVTAVVHVVCFALLISVDRRSKALKVGAGSAALVFTLMIVGVMLGSEAVTYGRWELGPLYFTLLLIWMVQVVALGIWVWELAQHHNNDSVELWWACYVVVSLIVGILGFHIAGLIGLALAFKTHRGLR